MKVRDSSPASKFTQHKVSITRIKDEIKKSCVRLYFINLFTFVCSVMEKYYLLGFFYLFIYVFTQF